MGDSEAYKTAGFNLKKGIRDAKLHYKMRIEEHFNSSNSHRIWEGIKSITDYKGSSSRITNSVNPSVPNELNDFFVWFNRANNQPTTKLPLHKASLSAVTLQPHEVRRTLSHIILKKRPLARMAFLGGS